jgi:2-amino-4-hydroxy-6-hydroxymethyldihydropteridine diphosphokinase
VRPLLEELLGQGLEAHSPLRWSPLFRTAPVGGPSGQPHYPNGAVLVSPAVPATPAAAQGLLAALQELEQRFGPQRRERWGPRSLDLDLLWHHSQALELPHPRLLERAFVLAPLAAIDADQPGCTGPARCWHQCCPLC